MTSWRGLVVVLALLVAGGAAAALGEVDEGVDFSAALETWGDVLRDADQLGLKLTRIRDQEEMALGQAIVDNWGLQWVGPPAREYVASVGQSLVPRVRRPGIRYTFHVVESGAVNAFALPGGKVFVTTGMLGFLESEAELASVLGHEIAHVDLRHCVERFQYELALARVGMRDVGRFAQVFHRVAASGYSKYQELEADAQGLRLAIDAGYDPAAGAAVFERLGRRREEAGPRRSRTPVGELGKAAASGLGSYFRSHPPSAERARRLERFVARNQRVLAGRPVYVGVENLRRRVPRTVEEFPAERRTRP